MVSETNIPDEEDEHMRKLTGFFLVFLTTLLLAFGGNAKAEDMPKKNDGGAALAATAAKETAALAAARDADKKALTTGGSTSKSMEMKVGSDGGIDIKRTATTDGKTPATDKAAPPKADKPKAGAKKGKRTIVMQCDGMTVKKPGIAMVHGDPIWRSMTDGDAPKTAVCKADEAAVVVGNTQYKYDQQCLDYNRGKAGTDPNTWIKTGGLYAIAANVTQVGKEIRIWCVPVDEVITQDKFALLAQLAKQLKDINGVDWNAIRELLRQAPNFASKELVQKMIDSAMGPTKRLLNMVAAQVSVLEDRVDNLEAQSVSFELGGYGTFAYPTSFGGGLRLALNVPFAKSTWFWQIGAGVGAGYKDGQMSPNLLVDSSWNRQFGRVAIGGDLRFQLLQWQHTRLATLTVGPRLEVRLTGPDYSKLSPTEVRERNGKMGAELLWHAAVGVGGAVQPIPGRYNLGVGFDVVTGLNLRIGRRYPVKRTPDGAAQVAMAETETQEDPEAPVEN